MRYQFTNALLAHTDTTSWQTVSWSRWMFLFARLGSHLEHLEHQTHFDNATRSRRRRRSKPCAMKRVCVSFWPSFDPAETPRLRSTASRASSNPLIAEGRTHQLTEDAGKPSTPFRQLILECPVTILLRCQSSFQCMLLVLSLNRLSRRSGREEGDMMDLAASPPNVQAVDKVL
jgi:hypothetical protein